MRPALASLLELFDHECDTSGVSSHHEELDSIYSLRYDVYSDVRDGARPTEFDRGQSGRVDSSRSNEDETWRVETPAGLLARNGDDVATLSSRENDCRRTTRFTILRDDDGSAGEYVHISSVHTYTRIRIYLLTLPPTCTRVAGRLTAPRVGMYNADATGEGVEKEDEKGHDATGTHTHAYMCLCTRSRQPVLE